MDAGEQPLVEESTVPVVSDADPSNPSVRRALFLLPRAGDGAPPPAPPGDPGGVPAIVRGIEADFRGWAGVPRRWREWVDKLRPRHEPLWREVGILGAILASTCPVRRGGHDCALLQLAAFWSAGTSTFVFPWGEATLTLEDVAALAGLPLLGGPVRAPPESRQLEKDVAAIDAVRAAMNRSTSRKCVYGSWANHFVDRAPEEAAPPSAAGAGDGEARELVEHGAFLSMWLSLFVLPGPPFDVVRREVFPLAARLARGQRVALAPAALASIYHDLSALKRHITLGKENDPLVISAPMQILLLWVWEHFTQLCPEPAGSSAPGDDDMPRAARWHEVERRLNSKDVNAVFMSPKEFEWRPYGGCSSFLLPAKTAGSWVRSQDISTSDALLSFARCLHASELVGMNCIQQYSPHRVARQLGFDQDIPGTVPRASSGWEKAWETYNIEAKSSAFVVPNHKPGVTVQYAKWWEPYSSACGSAVANAAKMKEGHDFVSPVKRKMEGVLAGNSAKKLHVDTAIRGRPLNIPAGVNAFSSQSSASYAAIRRAAAAPGLVLRSCAPHLRVRAMPATGMPQPAPHATYDPLDHISLSKRLSSISKMPKQHSTERLVKGDEQERIVRSVNIFMPTSPSVDPNNAVLHKVVDQALADTVASSAIMVDELPCGFGTEREKAKSVQQSKDDHNSVSEENNNRTEDCDVVLVNVVQGAVSTGSSEAIGAGTEVDMLPTHEDFLVISDDDECDKSRCKGHEISAMHLKYHISGAKMSLTREQNKNIKLVDSGNNEQDSQVLKKVTTQGSFGEIIEISDDELDEETNKEAEVFDEETSKEDAFGTMHLESPKKEVTQTILQERNEEKQIVSKTNDEQDNLVMNEGTVQNSYNHQLASVLDDTSLRQQPDVLPHAAIVQTYDGLLQGPTEEMDTCIVTGDIDNTNKVPNENFGSLNFSEKANQDTLVSNREFEYPMEHSAGASSRKESGIRIAEATSESGNSKKFSSRLPDGNAKLVSSEVCTKTLYYLSRFDRTKDAWDKDANSTGTDQGFYLPRRAVGTMEMIEKASAIRQAEMAELKKNIDTMKEEILGLEAAERGDPLNSKV